MFKYSEKQQLGVSASTVSSPVQLYPTESDQTDVGKCQMRDLGCYCYRHIGTVLSTSHISVSRQCSREERDHIHAAYRNYNYYYNYNYNYYNYNYYYYYHAMCKVHQT